MKSNCLIEALKAKIKNPKSVTIHMFPLSLNNNQLHFYWIDDSENRVFHYAKANCNSFCCPLFEGVLKKRIRDCFEEKMMMAQNSPACFVYYSDLANNYSRFIRPVSLNA